MERLELRKWLLENAFTKNENQIDTHTFKRSPDMMPFLYQATLFFGDKEVSISHRIYAFLNGQTELYRCIVCGAELYPKDKNPSIYCSPSCGRRSPLSQRKSKETSLLRYGVEHPSQSTIVKKKMKETNMERYGGIAPSCDPRVVERMCETNLQRYGVEYYGATEESIQKVKATNLKRYGVSNAHNEDVKRKVRETNRKRYGYDNPMQSDQIVEKVKSTNRKRYGYDNPMQSDQIVEKVKSTNRKRYGYDWGLSSDAIRAKIHKTSLANWGHTIPSKSQPVRRKIKEKLNLNDYFLRADQRVLRNKDWLVQQYTDEQKSTLLIGSELNVHQSTVIKYLKRAGIEPRAVNQSGGEQILQNYLSSLYDGIIQVNIKSVIPPYELDIYIPEYNLAIEYDGVYWHSDSKGKDKKYHLNKTLLCAKKNIQLFHIFSTDNQDIWNDIIKAKLGLYDQEINVGQTQIHSVKVEEAYQFLMLNHLEGWINSQWYIGLFYSNSLVSLITLDIDDTIGSFKINRFCDKKGHRIEGSAHKLLDFFRSDHHGSILGYADLRWSLGELYDSLGFKLLYRSEPECSYTDDYLHLYKDILNKEDYDKIWDCGKLVYLLET